jgi:hypothetical protein
MHHRRYRKRQTHPTSTPDRQAEHGEYLDQPTAVKCDARSNPLSSPQQRWQPGDSHHQDVQDDLITELTRNPRNIIIGIADRLTEELSGQLDWLYERSPKWVLLFIGKTGDETKLAADPLRAATICDLVTIKTLNQKQLLTVLSSIHQRFLNSTPELQIEIDRTVLSGILNGGHGSSNVVSPSAIK